jgi:D-alanyl-D-alanine carboxypeptidase
MRNGVVVHATGLGVENPDGSKTATSATRFRIASVSKVFTAVAVMQLVANGKIALDKPFAAQLGLSGPFADARLAAITVRQLLSHTSGFPASKNMYFGRGVETWQQAGMAAVSQVLQSDPGAGFQYSNTNYCLLGLLLEHVTAKPFESLIRRQVLQPIGADAHLAPTADTTPGDAVHATSPGRNYMEALGPAGGWVASPVDIAKLASALRFDSTGEHLLDAAAVDEMRTTFGVPGPKDDWTYGLGFELFADGSWGHTGSIESTHAIVVNRPDGFTVAVLVSGKAPGNTDDLLGVIDLAIAGSRHG